MTLALAAADQEVGFHVDLYRPMLLIRRFEEHGVSPEALRVGATDVERKLGEVERAALDAPFSEPAAFAEFKE